MWSRSACAVVLAATLTALPGPVLAGPVPAGPVTAGPVTAGPPLDFTVYAFSQSDVDQEDPQVYRLAPDINIRAVGKWSTNGDEAADYNFAQIRRGADYVPVVDGHLNGAKSLQANYRYLKTTSREIAGDVPVTVFIDWPNDMMTAYLNLPPAEQRDYWRIFGAEAYANGIFPAFHLKDTVGSPTAEQQGLLGFLRTYSGFYREHRSLYRANDHDTHAVRVGAGNVAASLLAQRGSGTRTLHLVNHNYDRGIVPQTGFTVAADLPSCPRRVAMHSPDFAGAKTPPVACRDGRVTVTVDRLDYYNVLVLR